MLRSRAESQTSSKNWATMRLRLAPSFPRVGKPGTAEPLRKQRSISKKLLSWRGNNLQAVIQYAEVLGELADSMTRTAIWIESPFMTLIRKSWKQVSSLSEKRKPRKRRKSGFSSARTGQLLPASDPKADFMPHTKGRV